MSPASAQSRSKCARCDEAQIGKLALRDRRAARTRSLSMKRATHGRRAICCGRSIRRCARPGLCGFAAITSGIRLRPDSSKRGSMSIRSRNWAGGKGSRWCCAMHTISRRVCGEEPNSEIDDGNAHAALPRAGDVSENNAVTHGFRHRCWSFSMD